MQKETKTELQTHTQTETLNNIGGQSEMQKREKDKEGHDWLDFDYQNIENEINYSTTQFPHVTQQWKETYIIQLCYEV